VILMMAMLSGQALWMMTVFWPAGAYGIFGIRLLLLISGLFLILRLWQLAYREKPLEKMAEAYRHLSGQLPELPVPPKTRWIAAVHIGVLLGGAFLALVCDQVTGRPTEWGLAFEVISWAAALSYALRADFLRRQAARETLKNGLDDRRSRYRREAPPLSLRRPGMGRLVWGGLLSVALLGGQSLWRKDKLAVQGDWGIWGRCLEKSGHQSLVQFREAGEVPDDEILQACLGQMPSGLYPRVEAKDGGVLVILGELSGSDAFKNGKPGDQFMAWDAVTGLRISRRTDLDQGLQGP
jgi:hypothetical protein